MDSVLPKVEVVPSCVLFSCFRLCLQTMIFKALLIEHMNYSYYHRKPLFFFLNSNFKIAHCKSVRTLSL